MAVSDLSILLPRETGIDDEIDNISLVSVSENPPSGPIKIAHFLKILDLFSRALKILGKFRAKDKI